jgi:hypothetical protein
MNTGPHEWRHDTHTGNTKQTSVTHQNGLKYDAQQNVNASCYVDFILLY